MLWKLKLEFNLKYSVEVLQNEAKAVDLMTDVVDDNFSKAIGIMYDCKGSVIVTGMGKAGIVGQKISATLASTGTPSHFLHPAEAVHGDLGRVQQEDVVMVLSFGGETDEIVRLITLLKQREIAMIAITGKAESKLAKYSNVAVVMPSVDEAGPFGIAPTVSTTCMLAIGDSMALTIMKAREFSSEDFARFHPGGSLGAKLITVEQSMMFQPGQLMPVVNVDDTIKEMLVKTAELRRHGAVMVVNGQGQLAGIITDADLRRHLTENSAKGFNVAVGEVMTANPKCIRADSLAAEAMAIFHKFRIDELPVVDGDSKPVGMIDVQDIVAIKVVN